jgi:hypothetical protein
MQELKHIFEFLSLKKFIEKRTNLKYGSNLSCHIMGKPATKKDSRTSVTDLEKEEIKKSMTKWLNEALNFVKKW